MATWSKASNGQVTPPEAVRKARDKAFAQITAKMAGDDMLSVQGLGTGFHWDRPKFQRTSPRKATKGTTRKAHPHTRKLAARASGERHYGTYPAWIPPED